MRIDKVAEEAAFSPSPPRAAGHCCCAAGDVDFEGIKDRSELKSGMRLKVTYLEPTKGEAPLGFDIIEPEVEGQQ